jgi:hypothetical protein
MKSPEHFAAPIFTFRRSRLSFDYCFHFMRSYIHELHLQHLGFVVDLKMQLFEVHERHAVFNGLAGSFTAQQHHASWELTTTDLKAVAGVL